MSLTETCLTLAVVSVSLATAVPNLIRARDAYALNAAARDVAARLYAARAHAISRSTDCRLRVASPTEYVVECGNAPWEVVERTQLTGGLAISTNAKPEFHPRGNAAPAATISVWAGAGSVKRIVVNLAGRVRIE